MAMVACPKCGELNDQNAIFCAVCGTKLDQNLAGTQSKSPSWSIFARENIKNILGIIAGVIIVLSGIYAPWLGSFIIQTVLCLTASNRRDISLTCNGTPANSDWWLVIGVGMLLIALCLYDLLNSWQNRGDKSTTSE